MATPKSVLELAKKAGAKMVDIKFVDTFGTWQHFTSPISELSEETFAEGIGFDGSSIRGWKSIEASDMLAMPDPDTAFIDPFCAVPTLSLTCTIAETGTKEPTAATRAALPRKRKNISSPPASPTRRSSGRRPNSSSSTTSSSTPSATARFTRWTPRKPSGTPDAMKRRTSATKSATRKVISRSPRNDTQQDIRTEMVLTHGANWASRSKNSTTKWPPPARRKLIIRFDTLVKCGRCDDALQIRHQKRRPQTRQDRHVHAQAALRRQRLRHAHPPEHLEEG